MEIFSPPFLVFVGSILVVNENMPLPPHLTVGFTIKIQPHTRQTSSSDFIPVKLESLALIPCSFEDRKEKKRKLVKLET